MQQIIHLARRPPRWLRIAVVALLLAFTANSIAHVTHDHDSVQASVTHKFACGYCHSLDSIADAPRHHHVPPAIAAIRVHVNPALDVCTAHRPVTSALPRAPPCF